VKHDGHTIAGPGGSIRIEGDALAGLVVAAAELVDGVRVRRPRRGLTVAVADGRARIEIELAVRYGSPLPALGEAVQAGIGEALRTSVDLAVDAVDISIEELER
jgi:uncharacterized alkaline shock family protein YloU